MIKKTSFLLTFFAVFISCRTVRPAGVSSLATVLINEPSIDYDKVYLAVEKVELGSASKDTVLSQSYDKGKLSTADIKFEVGRYYFKLSFIKNSSVVLSSEQCRQENHIQTRTHDLNHGENAIEIYVCRPGGGDAITSNEGHLDNPFLGAKKWYVDPLWSENAKKGGGASIAGFNTGVWMDRRGAIDSQVGLSLKGHLDEAVNQGADLFLLVVYNLPDRDCSAEASNGELSISSNGLKIYKTEYIDKIASVLSSASYKNIRIIAVIEPDSIPNLVTNKGKLNCNDAVLNGYKEGIQYALSKFGDIENVYSYLDIAHSGWLGWDEKFTDAIQIFHDVIINTPKKLNSVSGFISNTSGYTPLAEPFLTDPELKFNGQPVRSHKFYSWNRYFGELQFVQNLRTSFIEKGFPSSIGMLVDTSRNGWGGSGRPTSPSSSSDLNTYVNQSKIDRRVHRGNWCNQAGGIGVRPQANPAPGVHAYVWVKPPGESDGVSSGSAAADPNDPAKKFDQMCSPAGHNINDQSAGSGAIESAPHAGRWNQLHFDILLQNANPPL